MDFFLFDVYQGHAPMKGLMYWDEYLLAVQDAITHLICFLQFGF